MNDPIQNRKATLFIHYDLFAADPKTGQLPSTLFLMSCVEADEDESSFHDLDEQCMFLGENSDGRRERIVSTLESWGIQVKQVDVIND